MRRTLIAFAKKASAATPKAEEVELTLEQKINAVKQLVRPEKDLEWWTGKGYAKSVDLSKFATITTTTNASSPATATGGMNTTATRAKQVLIDRRSNLSVNEFIHEYALPRRPVVITDVATSKNAGWQGAFSVWSNMDEMNRRFGERWFQVGDDDEGYAIMIPMSTFIEYMQTNQDDHPLYILDEGFADTAPEMLRDYQVPNYFQNGYFEKFLPPKKCPPYRWFVMGPARSGSAIHLDPFKSSAWNALICGRKRWTLFPPQTDLQSVTTTTTTNNISDSGYTEMDPLDWYMEMYPKLIGMQQQQQMTTNATNAENVAAVTAASTITTAIEMHECVQEPGDLVYVPSGWYHTVLNLDPINVAVTQNVVDATNYELALPEMQRETPELAEIIARKLRAQQKKQQKLRGR